MNFFLGGRGAGPGSQCGVAACTLAFATLRCQDSVRNYACRVSLLDETGFYAPSVAHNALPRRPWRCISVVLSIILQTLGSFAMRSRKSMCVRRPLRLRPLRCGKMCGVTCAHRWPVLTSYYVVERCETMCSTPETVYPPPRI